MAADRPPRVVVSVEPRSVRDEVRATGVGLVIAGMVSLYFGTQIVTVVPADLSAQQQQVWHTFERGLFIALRGVGASFLVAAVLAWAGWRGSQLLAAVAEAACGVLMLLLGASWLYKHWLIGGFNWFTLAVLALAGLSLISVRQSWRLYRMADPAAADELEPSAL